MQGEEDSCTGVGHAGFCTGSHRGAEPYIAPWSSRCVLALDRVTPKFYTGVGTGPAERDGAQAFEEIFVALVPARGACLAHVHPSRPRNLVGPRLAGRRPLDLFVCLGARQTGSFDGTPCSVRSRSS